jgi:hypothetical protein
VVSHAHIPSSLLHKSAGNLMLEGTTLLSLHYVAENNKMGANKE